MFRIISSQIKNLEGKMKFLLVCAALCLINSLCVADGQKDIDMTMKKESIKGATSEIQVTFIGHASLMLENNDNVYYIDPWSDTGDYSNLPKADVIFVTHEHFDHYDNFQKLKQRLLQQKRLQKIMENLLM